MPAIAAASVPLYARIAQALADEIAEGRWAEGAFLPVEAALCERFQVSRITVRSALRELEVRGLISRRPGVGTRVVQPRQRFVHASDTIEELLHFTAALSFRLLALEKDGGDLRVRGLRVAADGSPIILSEHVIPARFAAVAGDLDGALGSLAVLIERRFGLRIQRIRQQLEPALLTAPEAELLELPAGEAAIVTRREYLAAEDVLLLASRSLYPRTRCAFSTTLEREPTP